MSPIFSDILPVLIIIIISFIIMIILKYKLSLNNKQSQFVFFACFVGIILPSLRTIKHIYFQVKICGILFIVLYTIWISSISLYVRLSLILSLLLIYYRNLRLISSIITNSINIIRLPKTQKRDDKIVRRTVENIYKQIGIRIISNFEKFPDHPTMILANYCRDRVENVVCIIIPRKISVLMGSAFKNVNMSGIISNPIYINASGKGNTSYISEEIRKTINDGNDIFAYINTIPSYFDYIGALRSGMFRIAIEHNISITPITFDVIDTTLGFIPKQNYFIRVGDTFYPQTIENSKYRVTKFFRESLRQFKQYKYHICPPKL